MATAKAKATAKRLTLARAITPGGSRAATPSAPKPRATAPTTRTPGQVVPLTDPSRLRTTKKPTVPAPGVVPGSTIRVPAPARQGFQPAPSAGNLLANAQRARDAANPKTSSTHTMTGAQAKPLYHKPTPAPVPSRSPGSVAGAVRTPISAPAPAATPAPMAPANTHLMGTGQGFMPPPPANDHLMGSGAGFAPPPAASPVTAAPVTNAPPPATPPVAAPVAAQPAAAPDPYAAYPPEVAALLRANDETLAAQQRSLSGYFGSQAAAAQDFAKAIGTQTGNLAQLAGIPVGAENQATSGIPGAVGALPGALGTIAQHLGGAQGLSTTNAAAMVPGFLRTAGGQAQTTLESAGQTSRQKVLSDYIDQQGKLAQTQAEQQGMDARQAAQIGSQERIAAANQAVTSANNTLHFLSTILSAQLRSGDAAAANQTKAAIAQANNELRDATNARDNQTRLVTNQNTVNASLTKTAATTGAKTGVAYTKRRSDWVKNARALITGKPPTPTATQKVKDKAGNTITVKGWTDANGQFTQTPPATGQDAAGVLAQMITDGITPRDAFNIMRSTVRTISGATWQDPEVDLYEALGGTGSARKLVLKITGMDPVATQNPGYS